MEAQRSPAVVKLDFPDKDLYILAEGDWHGFRSIPCKKEPETVEWIRSFDSGSTFWDVGASVGSYSLIAAALGSYVHAFEPFAPSYGHLVQNVWLNGLDGSIAPLPVALTTSETVKIMGRLGEFRASNTAPGSASHKEDGQFTQWVVYEAFDDEPVFDEHDSDNHVKIDVDGAELEVIEGGRDVWKNVKSIMVESEPGPIDDIGVILHAAGLHLVDSWKRWGETKQRNYLFRRA